MKRLEALSIASALGFGSLAGFSGARWGSATVDARGAKTLPTEVVVTAAATPLANAAGAVDSAAAGDRLAEILDDPLRSRRLVALDRFCDALDAEEARAAVQSLSAGEDAKGWEARNQLLRRWAELEPEAAAAFVLEKMKAQIDTVLEVWVARDREAAKRFVAGIKDRDALLEVLPTFAGKLAEGDFEDALRFATALPADQFQNAVRLVFYRGGQKNPAANAARARAMPEGEARASAISAAADVWIGQNPQAAMAWVMQQPDTPMGHGGTLLESTIQSWSSTDPASAGRFVQSLPAGKKRDNGIKTVAQSWVWEDLEGGLRWVQSLPEDAVKREALSSVVRRWAYDDPAAAAAFIAQQTAGAKTGEMLENVGGEWAKRDPAAALAWAARQTNETLQKNVAAAALGTWAADDPAGAVAGLAALRGDEARAAAVATIAKSWADRDPQEAARWVLSLPATDANGEALKQVISTGTSRDPVAMAGWLESLRGQPQRDAAVEAFARAAQYHDPTAAAEWANTLSDAAKRKPLVQKIVRDYANYDAASARAWVLGQRFEAIERAALLGQIEKAEQRK